jgi:hypothetical protein
MTPEASARSLEDLRKDLTDKLGELHRRATHAKHALTPSTYWQNPWLRVGLGLVGGLVVGSQLRGVTRGGVMRAIAFVGLGVIVGRSLLEDRT